MADEKLLFPYPELRDAQKELIVDAQRAITFNKNLLAHAPTGLGKTISVLGPALKYAIDNKKTVFFLTSRHTQHILALRTLADIKKQFNIEIKCADIIGKKWMCAQPGAETMPASEFSEYCKSLREDNICMFYSNVRKKGKISIKAEQALIDIKEQMPADTETINNICREGKLCPYEVTLNLVKEANVVIADYNYIFNERIRDGLFLKTGKKIEDCIVIIDEGHNLPSRCREMLSTKLSSFVLTRAIQEAKKLGHEDEKKKLIAILDVLNELGSELDIKKDEEYVFKNEFVKKVDSLVDYEETQDRFLVLGDEIREKQRSSFIGSVGSFMDSWKGDDKGYCRSVNLTKNKYGDQLTLNYRCLDPGIVTRDVINSSVSTILMSGTLTPVNMYADLLGFRNFDMKEYIDPFSEKNRLNMIIEDVTTKYTARSPEMYRKMGTILSEIVNSVPGNTFVFFPSYDLRNQVNRSFERLSKKTVFQEVSGMSKDEKKELLEKFKDYKNTGAVLLGVTQGSFGEGVDMPGDLLKCVVVVGVPLTKPDLETKELIEYYDDKFGEGMNYGYIYPAITKTMQNAGRCIRSEKDRGVIVFMDARYSWENYNNCFPKNWNMKVTKMWEDRINGFFS